MKEKINVEGLDFLDLLELTEEEMKKNTAYENYINKVQLEDHSMLISMDDESTKWIVDFPMISENNNSYWSESYVRMRHITGKESLPGIELLNCIASHLTYFCAKYTNKERQKVVIKSDGIYIRNNNSIKKIVDIKEGEISNISCTVQEMICLLIKTGHILIDENGQLHSFDIDTSEEKLQIECPALKK